MGRQGLRQHARNVVDEAAAGDMGQRLEADAGLERREQGFDVDAGGGEQGFRERPALVERRLEVPVDAGDFDDAPDQRIAVGMHARGGDGDETR